MVLYSEGLIFRVKIFGVIFEFFMVFSVFVAYP